MDDIYGEGLGSAAFRAAHGLRFAYVAGSMYRAISSIDLVVSMGRARMLSFFGTGGLSLSRIEQAVERIRCELGNGEPFGMNLLYGQSRPQLEQETVALYLRSGVSHIETSAFLRMTAPLVQFRLTGATRTPGGRPVAANRILAKLSRLEVAERFLRPPPDDIVRSLRETRRITAAEAELASELTMADDVCVECDSAGHTDGGAAYALFPAMLLLRDEIMKSRAVTHPVRIGVAGGIGTPHSVAAAFGGGADFVLTGSINQCTVEAGASQEMKDILEQIDVHETTCAPAGDTFESGAQVQVARRGLLFPARAKRLYELYRRHRALEEIDIETRVDLERNYFGRSLEEVWERTKAYHLRLNPGTVDHAEASPKRKMALVFKWYLANSARLAIQGDNDRKLDYQIQCGPAMGAFNRWVKGTDWQRWRNRYVALIGERLMREAELLLRTRLARMFDEQQKCSHS